jgi:hypothetical protein
MVIDSKHGELKLEIFSTTLCGMTADFQYTEADFVSAQIAWLMKHPFVLIRGFWYPIALLVVVAIAVFNHPEHWRNAVIGALIAIGLVALSLIITRWRWRRQFCKTPWMQNRVSAIIDGKGVKLTGQSFEATDHWSGISEACESSGLFMFVRPGKSFVFIPKRAMTQLQLNEIRATIVSNARGKIKLAASTTPV